MPRRGKVAYNTTANQINVLWKNCNIVIIIIIIYLFIYLFLFIIGFLVIEFNFCFFGI